MAILNQQQNYPNVGNGQFYPYNNNLLMNTPYDNYMGRSNNQFQNPATQYLKCRPVSSKEEARACQIDLDGSLYVFTDVGNDKIYTKQINNDGTATFKTYELAKDENPYAAPQYVTKDQFNATIQQLMAAMTPQQHVEAPVQSKKQESIQF